MNKNKNKNKKIQTEKVTDYNEIHCKCGFSGNLNMLITVFLQDDVMSRVCPLCHRKICIKEKKI